MRKKSVKLQNLNQITTYFEETGAVSEYFNITDFPEEMPTGRSSFLILGSRFLKENVNIKIEILDNQGQPVYIEPVFNYEESNGVRVSVEVYQDVNAGACTLTVLGEVDQNQIDETIPNEFQNVYNVKYTRNFIISKDISNTRPIRFFKRPGIGIKEVFRAKLNVDVTTSGSLSQSLGTVTGVPVPNSEGRTFQPDSADYGDVVNYTDQNLGYTPIGNLTTNLGEKYQFQIQGADFSSSMQGGTITISNPVPNPSFVTQSFQVSNAYSSSILEVLNKNTITVQKPFGLFNSSSGDFQISGLGASNYEIVYPKFRNFLTSSIDFKSFAEITVHTMRTFSGDVYRLAAYVKDNGPVGNWVKIADTPIESPELLVDSNSTTGTSRLGFFRSDSIITSYYERSGGAFGTEVSDITIQTASDPEFISNSVFISSSIDMMSDSEETWIKLQLKNQYSASFIAGNEYVLRGKFIADNRGGSQSTIKAVAHFSGSAFNMSNEYGNFGYGRAVGIVRIDEAENQLFRTNEPEFEAVFAPDRTGTGVLQLRFTGGHWHVSDLSLRPASETNFSPDIVKLTAPIPTLKTRPDNLDFAIEFYDINNNKSSTVVTTLVTSPDGIEFLGENMVIAGNDSTIEGSLFLGGESTGSGIQFGGVGSTLPETGEDGATGSGFIRSLGYRGFTSASLDPSNTGFMIYSGSVLPNSGDSYGGVGLELVGLSGSLRFSTIPSRFEVEADAFFVGNKNLQFISGSQGNIEISSSAFHLSRSGDVKISGSITATDGFIGNWQIVDGKLSGSNATLDANGAALFKSDQGPDTNPLDGFYIDFTPSQVNPYFVRFGSNFAVSSSGTLIASGAVIEGVLTASAGFIADWVIGSNSIHKSTGGKFTGLSSIGDTRFFGGAASLSASGSAPFNVKSTGDITGSSVLFTGGTIGGFLLSSTEISSSGLLLKSSGEITGSKALFDGGTIGGFEINTGSLKNSDDTVELDAFLPGLRIKDGLGVSRVEVKSGSLSTLSGGTQYIGNKSFEVDTISAGRNLNPTITSWSYATTGHATMSLTKRSGFTDDEQAVSGDVTLDVVVPAGSGNYATNNTYEISQVITSSISAGDTISFSSVARFSSSFGGRGKDRALGPQYFRVEYWDGAQFLPFLPAAQYTSSNGYGEYFLGSGQYNSFAGSAEVPQGTAYLRLTLSGSINDDSGFSIKKPLFVGDKGEVNSELSGKTFTKNVVGSSSPEFPETEITFDNFSVRSNTRRVEMTQEGLLIYNSEDSFFKMTAAGIEFRGGSGLASFGQSINRESFTNDSQIAGTLAAPSLQAYTADPEDIGTSASDGNVAEFAKGNHRHRITFSTINSVLSGQTLTSTVFNGTFGSSARSDISGSFNSLSQSLASRIAAEEAETGGVASVAAGSGLTGGGTGAITIDIGAGTGIDVGTNSISVDVSDFMTNGSNNRVLTATGTDAMNAESNLLFDGGTLFVSGNVSSSAAGTGSFGKLLVGGNPVVGANVAGNNTEIQFNNSGDFGASSNLTFNGSTLGVTGNITVTGNVDGRDLSTDGSKLDGIEAGATADQSNAEIRAAVEAASDSNVFTDADHSKLNAIESGATADQTASEIRTLVDSASDSNVFTDADHSKLDGIEASADVTDTANVTSAGALMDSEVTNLALVKKITDSDITGSFTAASSSFSTRVTANKTKLDTIESGATADQTASEIRTLVENASDSNVFTDADHSKLNAIEASATADQTITAGSGLTGGGSGDVTLNIGAGTGIDVAADAISVDVSDFMTNGSNDRIVTATGTDGMNAEANLTFNGDALSITSAADPILVINKTGGNNGAIHFQHAGAVKAFIYSDANGVLKFGNTTTNPVLTLNTNGTIAIASTIDGRDLATDGSKLDGIESGATADQTASEIRTLVENASDSNVFTDADHSKLNAIESGATADQSNAEIRAAVEAASDSNVFTDADHSKLNAIEASATADQTITAGTGLDGGGTGDVTLSVDVSDFMSNGSNNRVLTATGTDAMNAEANLTFDGTTLAGASTTTGSFGRVNVEGIGMTGTLFLAGGGASRILFNNLRSIEASTDGSALHLGEDFTSIRMRADIRPESNNSHDLGTSSFYWKNLYLNGNIIINGTVDGRDVATDGSKLDGIESGATADQTAADIRGLGFFDTSNDGASSGLDSDLLDGQHGSYYLDFGNFVIDNDEIPIAKLASDNVNFGGVTVTLGGSDTTPAFNLSDATGLPIVAGTTGTLSVARGGTGATSLNNLITLGTHTTGNYVASLVAGTGIDLSNNSGESATPTIAVDVSDFLSNGVNNRVVTATSADGLNGEDGLTFDGNDLGISRKIFHIGDTDTFINFTEDDINIQAGGVNFIDITQDSTNEITFNEEGADVNVRMEGDSDQNLFYLDAGNDRIGIGTSSPTHKLHVVGNTFIDGALTAREFYTDVVSSSISYTSGSNKFGDTMDDVHDFTGSLFLTGSAKIDSVELGTWPPARNYMFIGHSSLTPAAGNYALIQDGNGETLLNSASGRSLFLRINNSNQLVFTAGAATFHTTTNFQSNASTNMNIDSGDIASGVTINKSPTITLGGDLTGNATLTNLGNATLTATIAANSVALGTDTTGNFMTDVSVGTGLDVSHTPAEGSTATINLDLTEVIGTDGANRVLTSDGDGTLTGEANLTFNGSTLAATGAITATGNITSQGDITFGDTDQISTSTFTSGLLGDGFRVLDQGSDGTILEVDNVVVRNTLRTHIFQKDTVKATNGMLLVSDSGIISGSTGTTGTGTIIVEDEQSATFSTNEVALYKDAADDGTINTVKFTFNNNGTSAGGFTTYAVTANVGSLANLQPGGTFARISGGTVLIDASDTTNGPFIDVNFASGSTTARFGNLNGITSPRFGSLGANFGLWASGSAFLEGTINALSGNVGGWGIGENAISSSGGNITIDAAAKRITVNDDSNDRIYLGEIDGGTTYGIKIFQSGGGTSPSDSDILVELGENENKIVGWELVPGRFQFNDAAGSIALDATNKQLAIYTGSINTAKPKVVVGNLPTTGTAKYGFAVFSGSGNADINDDTTYSVLVTKDEARLAGWDLIPGALRSGTVADINGNQAKIALGQNATSTFTSAQPNLFYVSASTNPVFFVGENFSYLDDVLTAAGWKIGKGQISSSNGQAILSGSGVLSLGSGTHDYAQANRTYIDGPGNRMSIGEHFQYSGGVLAVGGWKIGNGIISSSTSADVDGVVIDSSNKVLTFHGADGNDSFHTGRNNVRLAVGQITSGIFGLVGFDGSGNTLLELSETQALIAGWNLSQTAISKNNVALISTTNAEGLYVKKSSFGDATAGGFLGLDSGTAKFNVGDGSKFIKFDGSDFSVNAGNFSLDTSGNMTATSATLTGTVTATAGQIGGFGIASGAISSSNNNLALSSTQASMSLGGKVKIAGGTDSFIAGGNHFADPFGAAFDNDTLGFVLGMDSSVVKFEVNAGDGENSIVFNSSAGNPLAINANQFSLGSTNFLLTNSLVKLGTIDSATDTNSNETGFFVDSGGDVLIKAGTSAETGYIQFNSNNLKIKTSNFEVDSGNVTMTGTVTAAAGAIGGWTLGANSITKGTVFVSSSATQPGLHITDGSDTILTVVSSSTGLSSINSLTGSLGSGGDAQFEDNQFELGSNGNLLAAASRWTQETIQWDTDLSAGNASQPNWLKDTDNALINPQCAELPSGTTVAPANFGTLGKAGFFRDIPVETGTVAVSAYMRAIGWSYYGDQATVDAYCKMEITGSDNATFSSGNQTALAERRVNYTSTKPTNVQFKIKNTGHASIRLRFIAVHDLSKNRSKQMTLGGWTVDGIKIMGISGNAGSGTKARTKPLVELTQDGLLVFSSKDSFLKLDAEGFEIKGDIDASNVEVQGAINVSGSLNTFSEMNISGSVNFADSVALALGHTNPESKIHVSESFFAGTGNDVLYPDSIPIGTQPSWRKSAAASYNSLAPGYAGDGTDSFSQGAVFRASSRPFLSNNANTGQRAMTAAYGTGHILDSYGRTQNNMMYGELIHGAPQGYAGSPYYMSGSIGLGKVWSYSSNKNQIGLDIIFAYGPNASSVGSMRQKGIRIVDFNQTTLTDISNIHNSNWGHHGFEYIRQGTLNVDIDGASGGTTNGGLAAIWGENNSDGTHGSSAGYGIFLKDFSKHYFSGLVGIKDTTPSFELDVAGTIRATGNVIAFSDIRRKENISVVDNAIDIINDLRGVRFNWTKEHQKEKGSTSYYGNKKINEDKLARRQIGLIAQEVEKVLPELVDEDGEGFLSVSYGNLVAVLVEANKEQQKLIEDLQKRVEKLEAD